MQRPFKVIVLFSGRGSNLRALIEQSAADSSYQVVEAITDNAQAGGIAVATSHGIPCSVFDKKDYNKIADCKEAIALHLQSLHFDLLVLAGFMQIIPESWITQWHGKIVNMHPSLLPQFPGLNPHQRALAAGEKIHGCTVHFVDAGVDTGPIIAQASCTINDCSSVDAIEARVLTFEHQLYPWVIKQMAAGLIRLEGDNVVLDSQARHDAERLGFWTDKQI